MRRKRSKLPYISHPPVRVLVTVVKTNVLRLFLATKFVLITSLHDTNAEALLQKVYEAYADVGMKNPFHTPEMPIRSEKFDVKIGALLGGATT